MMASPISKVLSSPPANRSEIRKQAGPLLTLLACHHWGSAGVEEVDLLLERDGILYPYGTKLTPAAYTLHGLWHRGCPPFQSSFGTPHRHLLAQAA